MEKAYLNRLNRFYQWMENKEMDAALITSPMNIYYFTGFYSNPHERFMGLFLLKNQDPILIVPELDKNEARTSTTIRNIYGHSDSEGADDVLLKHVPLSKKSIGLEQNNVSYKRASWLKGLFQIEHMEDIEEGLVNLRSVKDEVELKYLKEAAILADQAIQYGIESIEIGKSELEIIADIEYRLKKDGVEKMSFDTMVLAGSKTAMPHGNPGKNIINKNEFVLFDLGVVVNGYCSDISRTVVVGEPNEKQLEIYRVVKEAQQQAIDFVKPNVPIKDIDLAARNYISQHGYGDYFIHRTGHGLGLDVHELPSIHEKNNDTLDEGLVFTIEPGIYVPDVGGVRIEDDVVVKATGVDVLTSFTKELIKL